MAQGDSVYRKNATAYFTYGRFQPPTLGHAALFRTVKEQADAGGGDAYIFVSNSMNKMDKYMASKIYKTMVKTGQFTSIKENENPLSVYQKVKYLKKMHGDLGINIINTTEFGQNNIVDIVHALGPEGLGYTNLVMLVGSDRVPVFKKTFKDVAFIRIEPYGAKRQDGGISGTKMRLAAVSGNFAEFKSGVMTGAMTEADAFDLMNDIRVGLALQPLVKVGGTRKSRNKLRRTAKNAYW